MLILCLSGDRVLLGAGSAGQSGADFLEIGTGSRPLSMGEAFTAEINDVNSIYYNPAGLGSLKYPVLSFQHQELVQDSRFENVSFAYPFYGGYIGASNSIFWVPPFDKIDISGNTIGDVKYYNGNLTVGYGYDLDFMMVGGSMKYIYQQIDTELISSFAIDLGVMTGLHLYSPFDAPIRNLHMGLSIQNLGSNAKNDPLPRLLRMGFSYKMTKWLGFNMDLTESLIEASDIYDFTYGFDESFRLNMGMEVTYLDILSLRGGYRFNDGSTYSFGLGFNFVINNVSVLLDTSYSDSGIFGPVYSFNVTFKLIPKVVTILDRRMSEDHYKKGIKFFVEDEIEASLNEFRLSRDYDPYHKNVSRKIEDLEEIQRLKKENQELDKELQKR